MAKPRTETCVDHVKNESSLTLDTLRDIVAFCQMGYDPRIGKKGSQDKHNRYPNLLATEPATYFREHLSIHSQIKKLDLLITKNGATTPACMKRLLAGVPARLCIPYLIDIGAQNFVESSGFF